MDLVYRARWKPDDVGLRQKLSQSPVSCAVAWSSRKIIAFVAQLPTKLVPVESKETIILFSPDEPWNISKITSLHSSPVHHLVWDDVNCHLLSIDAVGHACVWAPKEGFSNLWRLKWELPAGGPNASQPLAALFVQQAPQYTCHQPFRAWPEDSLSLKLASRFVWTKAKSPLPLRLSGWLMAMQTGEVKLCLVKGGTVVTNSLQLVSGGHTVEAADLAALQDGTTVAAMATSCHKIQVSRLELSFASNQHRSSGNTHIASTLLALIDTASVSCPRRALGRVGWMRLFSGESQTAVEIAVCVSSDTESYLSRWTMTAAPKTPSQGTAASIATVDTKQVTTTCTHHNEVDSVLTCGVISRPSYAEISCSASTSGGVAASTASTADGGSSDTASSASTDRGQSVCLGDTIAAVSADGSVMLLERSTLSVKTTSWPFNPHSCKTLSSLSSPPPSVVFSPSQCCLALLSSDGSLAILQLGKSLLPPTVRNDPASVELRANYVLQMLARCALSRHSIWDVMALVSGSEDGPLVLDKALEYWPKLFAAASDERPTSTAAHLHSRLDIFLDLLSCSSADAHRQVSVHVHCRLSLISFMSWVRGQLAVDTGIAVETVVQPFHRLADLCKENAVSPADIIQQMDKNALTLREELLMSIRPVVMELLVYVLRLVQPAYSPLSAKHPGVPPLPVDTLVLLRQLLVLVHVWSSAHPGLLSTVSTIGAEDGCTILFKQISKLYFQQSKPSTDPPNMRDVGVFMVAPDMLTAPPVACRQGHHSRQHFSRLSGAAAVGSGVCQYQYQEAPPRLNIAAAVGLMLRDPFASSSLRPPKALAPLREMRQFPTDVLQQITLECLNSKSQAKNGLRQCSRCTSLSSLVPFTSMLPAKSWLESWAHFCICGGQWKHISESAAC